MGQPTPPRFAHSMGAMLVLVLCLAACASISPVMLDPSSAADVERVAAYLNGMKTVQAGFMQVAPNDDVTEGMLWMRRPGQLLMQYEPPGNATLVATGGQLVFNDPASGATTTMPLTRTPLGLLLAPEIQLSGAMTLTQFQHVGDVMTLTMVRKSAPTDGALVLTIADHPLSLEALRIIDPRGASTNLRFFDIHLNAPVSPRWFQLSANPAMMGR